MTTPSYNLNCNKCLLSDLEDQRNPQNSALIAGLVKVFVMKRSQQNPDEKLILNPELTPSTYRRHHAAMYCASNIVAGTCEMFVCEDEKVILKQQDTPPPESKPALRIVN